MKAENVKEGYFKMGEQITQVQIKMFHEHYANNTQYQKIENSITSQGLEKACLNESIIAENPSVFNIELSETKCYDQKDSMKCWIFAGFNVIKRNMAENLKQDVLQFTLSDNYISFYDKLEKSNTIYEKVLDCPEVDIIKIAETDILNNAITECGNWAQFYAIVSKYGLVPEEIMPSTRDSENSETLVRLFSEKVKADVIQLVAYKKEKSLEELRIEKEKMLEANFVFLSEIMGRPPFSFSYAYVQKDNKKVIIKEISPLVFKNTYLTLPLENYIAVANEVDWDKQEYQKYKYQMATNIYQHSDTELLSLPINEIKDLVVKQLKDEVPVFMGISIKKYRYEKLGILDTRIYQYEKMLPFKRLPKKEAVNLNETMLHHFMNITGVMIEDGMCKRWKVEDSHGEIEKPKGYYVMNDNYFDDFVCVIVVDKQYLTIEQSRVWEQEAKLMEK